MNIKQKRKHYVSVRFAAQLCVSNTWNETNLREVYTFGGLVELFKFRRNKMEWTNDKNEREHAYVSSTVSLVHTPRVRSLNSRFYRHDDGDWVHSTRIFHSNNVCPGGGGVTLSK